MVYCLVFPLAHLCIVAFSSLLAQADEIEVHLAGGQSLTEGRVEVRLPNGEWGTVCDDYWDLQDATVVCRYLGYRYAISASVRFGEGTGYIYLDDVNCIGDESNLADCSHLGWGVHNCNHYEDAGVVCSAVSRNQNDSLFSVGSVRLVGGNSLSEGRVEVYLPDQWGTVCGDYWGLREARVVCRQLGYGSALTERTRFGRGSGSILLDDVRCSGGERLLAECRHSGWGRHDCTHTDDVGVVCSNAPATSNSVDVHLANGHSLSEGRVEVSLSDGVWGTVCGDYYWDLRDATVVCRHLGYRYAVSAAVRFGPGEGNIFLSYVDCTGEEADLADCRHAGWGVHYCVHTQDAGVVCSAARQDRQESIFAVGDIRLAEGNSPSEGRVEVYLPDQWGTVCDDHWTGQDAAVVCRQLGYESVISQRAEFGTGSGPILLSNVRCNGGELRLADCPHAGWGRSVCGHRGDVGVMCSNASAANTSVVVADIRLSDGQSLTEGRVEVSLFNGEWGSICDDNWDLQDATVVCRYLGYRYAISASPRFGTDWGGAYLDNVRCNGDESNIVECPHAAWGVHSCDRRARAGVVCSATRRNQDESIQPVGSIRLVGGSLPSEGRVELYLPDQWGTVCDDNWDLREATVVCRQLGYASVVSAHVKFGAGSGSILLDDIHCSGGETLLVDCPHAGWGRHDCGHGEDVGIRCSNDTMIINVMTGYENSYRLFGGSSSREGVLQYRSTPNETWNSVCLTLPDEDPNVVVTTICSLVGYKFCCGSGTVASLQLGIPLDMLRDFPLKKSGVSCLDLPHGDRACSLVTNVTYTESCALDEAIWVLCDSDIDFRLKYGISEREGLLQARCRNSRQWNGVCGDRWKPSTHAHQLACRHVGFHDTPHISSYVVPSYIALSTPVNAFLNRDFCSGEEESLLDCGVGQLFIGDCAFYAGLKCISEERSLKLRLIDSEHEGAGIVQGRWRPTDKWGAICQYRWDDRDAQVVCRHLGFLNSIYSKRGNGVTNISIVLNSTFLSAVGCYGHEPKLSQCELLSDTGFTCSAFPYIECMAETTRFDIPAYLCGEIHYCGYDCSQGPRNTHREFIQETCKCDDACLYFDDCCYDYQANCNPATDWLEVRLNGVDVNYYACVWVPGSKNENSYEYSGFALVSLCPEWWTDPSLQHSCEGVAAKDDAIGSLPVYIEGGAVYKNIFCAICHGIKPEVLRKWTVIIQPSGSQRYNSKVNVSVEDIPVGRYAFDPPKTNGTTRLCPVKTRRSCRAEFANKSLEAACKEYFAPLVLNGTRYHNPHCAMCNGLVVEPTASCQQEKNPCEHRCDAVDNWGGCKGKCGPSSYLGIEALFDFGWGGDNERSSCRSGQLFDPFLQRCRTVFCVSGTTNEDGACVLDPRAFSMPSKRLSDLNDKCNALMNSSFGTDALYWQTIPTSGVRSQSELGGDFSLAVIFKSLEEIQRVSGDFASMFQHLALDIEFCNFTPVTVFVYEGTPLLSKLDACVNATMEASDVFHTSRDNDSSLNFTVSRLFTWTVQNSSFISNTVVPTACLDVLNLHCTGIRLLREDEYVFQSNAPSIKHISREKEFGPNEFAILPDGMAAVCGPIDWTDPANSAKEIVSLICSCLSILALTATLFTYCMFPELRNMAGVYIMNLVGALLVAMLFLVLAWGLDFEGYVCLAAASVNHFALLSAFFWMATVSCNAAKTFGRKSALFIGTHLSYSRMLVSMAFVWGGALLVVSICLTLNFCNCTSLPVIYSQSQPCLIAHASVRLVALGVPVASSLLTSSVSLIIVLFGVRRSKRDSRMVQKRGKMEEMLDEVKIYAKLTLLFGTTWILAFVSEAVDHVVLSYVNVILNTLQGVFIFLAFCLNQRVRTMWRKRLSLVIGKDRRDGRQSSSNVSHGTQNPTGSSEVNSKDQRESESRL